MTQERRQIGKRVIDELYVHVSAVGEAAAPQLDEKVQAARSLLPPEALDKANVVKFNLKSERLSLLEYPDFEEAAFPTLRASWTRASPTSEQLTYRSYEQSLNPPILHRKELLVAHDHPRRAEWTELTTTAENLGLFDDPTVIGFQANWDRLIASKGYQLVGASFQPLGNEIADLAPYETPLTLETDNVQRHLTALSRNGLSAPVQLLLRHGLLTEQTSFFDYGCGRGDDLAALRAEGLNAGGWDPHYAADNEVNEADVVNLGFVINVIEDPAERVEALSRAYELTRQVLSVSVMLYSGELPGRPYGDGFITSRSTFQKYFSQGEFKDWLEQVLHHEAILVGPGVAFVFADDEAEQRFLAGRYRRREIADRLLISYRRIPRPRVPRPPKPSRREQLLESARPALDALWSLTLDLGRYPEPDEIPDSEAVTEAIGSLRTATRLLAEFYDATLLDEASRARSDDLCVFFAMQQFEKRRRYKQLDTRLQRDIKAFFGDYSTAKASGVRLLLQAADSTEVLHACQAAASQGLGWLDGDHSLQLHVSLVERLPAVLRAYVGCGLVLYGELGPVDLVKIHIASGKLTLMEFEAFSSSALPRMRKRIKVNIRRQDYDVFEYGNEQYPMPLLYRKSRYLNEDSIGYAEQLAFDEALEATGLLDEREHGPHEAELLRSLELMRLAILDGALVPSQVIPDLDQPCGAYLRYRDLIECGETQKRLHIPNLPSDPRSFNALYALATKVLDPVIDYFGSIKLTYGFCSQALAKHIKARVAPNLDQHAAYECNTRGKMVCDRGGAACDFVVEDENMREVADWIIGNTSFDRLYYYGPDRPIHVSASNTNAGLATELVQTASGRLVPRRYRPASLSNQRTRP